MISSAIKTQISCFAKGCSLAAICLFSTNATAAEYQRSYPVTGTTMQQLLDQIQNNSHSPSGAFGYTKLNTNLNWKSIENSDGVCSVESANFTYDITIYMPQWLDIHNAKLCLQHNWNLVWHEVQLHEEEHQRLYRLLNPANINQRIAAIEPQTSCENLKAAVNAEMKSILDANDRLHDLFHAKDTPPTFTGC